MTAPAATTVYQQLPLSLLDDNPWNPNVCDADTMDRLKQSLSLFGPIDPVTAVSTPDGRYRILDGEHRAQAARLLDWDEFPVCVIGSERDISPARQRQITLLLNELHGTHDRAKTALLIHDIYQLAEPSGEIMLLPYSDTTVENLLAYPTPGLHEPQAPRSTRHIPERRAAPSRSHWQTMTFTLPDEAAAVVRQALDAASDDGAGEDDWQALEALAAEYLAGRDTATEDDDDARPS